MLDWVFRSFWIREEEYNCYHDRLSSDFKQKSRRKIGTSGTEKRRKVGYFLQKAQCFWNQFFLYGSVVVTYILQY